ncbi:MAG: fumarate hydratase [Candidatus Bathyarchaeota archaeon]|nr:fumarate hydratase [Candidatus Bathyarchaeota archaeon]
MVSCSLIKDVALKLLELAAIRLPDDVKDALRKAYYEEKSPIGRLNLKNILENIELAEKENIPVCQDTGIISFYLKAGSRFRGLGEVEGALRKAVREATLSIPLRPNAVDFFSEENSGDNTGRYLPYLIWDVFDGDYLEITALLKGGGSENACTLKMMNPSEGLNGLKRFILESVIKAGGLPCPPTIIGVGLGGGADISMSLAKRALLKPLNEKPRDERIASLEEELREAVNMTGIGPMGLGGNITALAVKVEYAHRHPASYPAAIAFQCWAARRATARILSDNAVEYLTHKV